MSRPGPLNTLLFWFMVLAGTAVLAPCLILPAWLERQAQLECLQAQAEYKAALEQRLRAVRTQIDHLNNDPAYLLRLAEQDFGGAFRLPNVETIQIAPGPASVAPASPPPAAAVLPDEALLPEIDRFLEGVMRRYVYAQVFVDGRSRPLLMALGGGLIGAGILLLGLLPGRRPDPQGSSAP